VDHLVRPHPVKSTGEQQEIPATEWLTIAQRRWNPGGFGRFAHCAKDEAHMCGGSAPLQRRGDRLIGQD